jgi:Spy/CpxP family protein refolding chaperone
MKKWLAGAAVIIFAFVGVAFAVYRHGMPGEAYGFHGPRYPFVSMSQRILGLLDNDQFRAKTNLTDDQANRLRQIVLNAEESSIKTRAQIEVEGIELRELLRQDKPDQDAVLKRVQQISQLRGQMMQENIKALLAAKDVLTPEQQKAIRQFMERGSGEGRGEANRAGWGILGKE